jgi:hypothetical protein
VEDREARLSANVLLVQQMDNSCMLVAPAGTPAPLERREVGAQTPVETTPAKGTRGRATRALGTPVLHREQDEAAKRLMGPAMTTSRPWWKFW